MPVYTGGIVEAASKYHSTASIDLRSVIAKQLLAVVLLTKETQIYLSVSLARRERGKGGREREGGRWRERKCKERERGEIDR